MKLTISHDSCLFEIYDLYELFLLESKNDYLNSAIIFLLIFALVGCLKYHHLHSGMFHHFQLLVIQNRPFKV